MQKEAKPWELENWPNATVWIIEEWELSDEDREKLRAISEDDLPVKIHFDTKPLPLLYEEDDGEDFAIAVLTSEDRDYLDDGIILREATMRFVSDLCKVIEKESGETLNIIVNPFTDMVVFDSDLNLISDGERYDE